MSEDVPNNSEVLKKMTQYLALYRTYWQFSTTQPSSCEVNCDISVLTKYRVIYNVEKCFNSSCNIAHIFHAGVRIWSVSVSWREIEVFSSQA